MFLKNIIKTLRPKQWLKNIFLFAAIIFVREFSNLKKDGLVLIAFISFCLASSAVYTLNDVLDAKSDALHPAKKLRPIASGALSQKAAFSLFAALLLLSFGSAYFFVGLYFTFTVALYVLLNILYSFWFKKLVILDVLFIALGFVIRVVAGAVAISVTFSPWLIFCTFFLTLFLAVAKRKNELRFSPGTRAVLNSYSLEFLDHMNMVVLPLTLMTYTLYTFFSEHSRALMITVPIVLYGLLRYVLVTEQKTVSDDGPTDDVLSDRPLQATVFLWVATVVIILVFLA